MTPERILRRGFTLFIAGTLIACWLIAAGVKPLGFIVWSVASILLVMTSLAYWRVTGKEIISPGMSLVLISLLFVLVVVLAGVLIARS